MSVGPSHARLSGAMSVCPLPCPSVRLTSRVDLVVYIFLTSSVRLSGWSVCPSAGRSGSFPTSVRLSVRLSVRPDER